MTELKNLKKIARFILLFSIGIGMLPSHAASPHGIAVAETDSDLITLEYKPAEIQTAERVIKGRRYQKIHMPDTGAANEPGQPQLPMRGALIAIPEGARLQVSIADSDSEIRSGYLVSPAPAFNPSDLETPDFIPDGQSYRTDRFQPAAPVKIGIIGHIREQRVAQIQFFPVQHNPVQQTLRIYKRLRVKVSFSNPARAAGLAEPVFEDSPQFDKMLQHLLINHATADRVLQRSRSPRTACPPPPQPALKITINKTGVYALNYADFLALGVDISMLNARWIHLSHEERSVPIFIDGEADGSFGPEDRLYFYAIAAGEPRDNLYWLSLNPDGGARFTAKEAAPAPAHPQRTGFTRTVHVENNNIYWSHMPDSTNRDRLFWELLGAGDSLEMPLVLHHPVQPRANVAIRVMMQGKTDIRAINQDHHTKILLNGVEIHDARWDGQTVFLQQVSLPQAQLREGKNSVTLVSAGDTGAVVDLFYINWLEIDYSATMTAVQDHLTFNVTGSGPYNLTVSGFTRPELLVLDITDPLQPLLLPGAMPAEDDAGLFQLQFADVLDGGKTYYAFSFSEAHILKPAALNIYQPDRRLQSPCHRADYFIIYHDSFDVKALQKSLVAACGLEVMAVPVSEIYDEFNHGVPHPRAIKDFLTYAYENYTPPRPAYVLLAGDANADTLNELGDGINYVPTHTFHTSEMGETASDNWFVSVSGDDPLPDMFLGRIPVRTQAELDAVVKKLTDYAQAPLDGWQRNVLFVADDDLPEFEAVSERLIEQYLADYIPRRIYLGQYGEFDIEAVTQEIIQAINVGAVITNYTGHGSVNLWAAELIFSSEDVALLHNPDKLTFVLALNCQNGWFSYHQPFRGSSDSLAETFLKTDGKGAIGMLASSGLGYTSEHEILANEFFRCLFQENETELGSLTAAAKIAAVSDFGVSTNLLEMFTLFGDPGLRLRLE
ncbi:MAG: hypothetical protein GY862_05315 [Gammaproteobacteria bacterium]|nr:hypothetical protein [Gammaproteobacteria bacterium]